jgi:hypothetical protein
LQKIWRQPTHQLQILRQIERKFLDQFETLATNYDEVGTKVSRISVQGSHQIMNASSLCDD